MAQKCSLVRTAILRSWIRISVYMHFSLYLARVYSADRRRNVKVCVFLLEGGGRVCVFGYFSFFPILKGAFSRWKHLPN